MQTLIRNAQRVTDENAVVVFFAADAILTFGKSAVLYFTESGLKTEHGDTVPDDIAAAIQAAL